MFVLLVCVHVSVQAPMGRPEDNVWCLPQLPLHLTLQKAEFLTYLEG